MDSERQYAKGSISHVTLKDFMTYSEVTLQPGPDLNLILGPNGTGKSSLVCGIIMGLAGDASATGRSGSSKSYIRHGASSAEINIGLHNPGCKELYTIQRKIFPLDNQDGRKRIDVRSEWMLNGKPSKVMEVRAFVRSLNIRVDNMCQFLPQEKVIEFSKMNPVDLLQNTEKAVGEEVLFPNHEKLMNLTKHLLELRKEKQTLSYQTNVEEKQTKSLQTRLEQINEKKKQEEKFKNLNLKKPWLNYLLVKEQFENATHMLQQKKDLQRTKNLEIAPLEKKLKEIEKLNKSHEVSLNQAAQKCEAKSAKISGTKRTVEAKFANSAVVEYKRKLDAEKARLQEVNVLKETISTLQLKLADAESQPDRSNELDALQEQIAVKQGRKSDAFEEKLSFEAEQNTINPRIAELSRKVTSLENIAGQRMDVLRRISKPAYDALEWLNKNKNLFSHPVHPPIVTQINVTNMAYVNQLEAAIPRRDLLAFVFENEGDLTTFTNRTRELGMRVATVMAPSDKRIAKPSISLDYIANYGFKCYLSDVFSAPEAIKAYLCKQYRLYEIPVGDATVNDRLDDIQTRARLSNFFSSDTRYTINLSKYDGQSIMSTSDFNKAQLLIYSLNERELTDLKFKLEEQYTRRQDLQEKIRSIISCDQDLSNEIKALSLKKREILMALDYIDKTKKDLDSTNKELKVVETRKFDADAELKKAKAVFDKQTGECMILLDQLNKANADYAIAFKDKLKKQVLLQTVASMEKVLSNKVRHFKALHHSLEIELAELNTVRESKKRESGTLRRSAIENFRAKNISVNSSDELPADVAAAFEGLPDEMPEIDNEIMRCECRIDELHSIAEEGVEDEYNARTGIIQTKSKSIREIDQKISKCEAVIEKTREEWLPPLNDMIQRISSEFVSLMAKLNYKGEVVLKTPEVDPLKPGEPVQYDKYGVGLNVSYREDDETEELSTFQSGGERSVATMIYMIALQELTKVPFRVVDEINQGMDSNNERKVFDIIVQTAEKNSSQYFMFSPKLLLGLDFTEKMKIHIIMNGRHVQKGSGKHLFVE
ncbi:Structural maintenance of chromosomes protein 5 [Halotydeus destructor]|nr:Structural maintenance of chromosomes protein 5 [Halotydeus destructor]